MIGNELTFRFRNDQSELEPLKEQVKDYLKSLGLPPKDVFQVLFTVEEIFVNIISYGYEDDQDHWITFRMSHHDDTVTIGFEDDGVCFNPLTAPEPDVTLPLEERKEGGLGLHLTKSLASEICYSRKAGKNHLTIKKVVTPCGCG
jgi:anti-sigma regulatory factor (Ser/Thr protein kinase)